VITFVETGELRPLVAVPVLEFAVVLERVKFEFIIALRHPRDELRLIAEDVDGVIVVTVTVLDLVILCHDLILPGFAVNLHSPEKFLSHKMTTFDDGVVG